MGLHPHCKTLDTVQEYMNAIRSQASAVTDVPSLPSMIVVITRRRALSLSVSFASSWNLSLLTTYRSTDNVSMLPLNAFFDCRILRAAIAEAQLYGAAVMFELLEGAR